MLSLTHLFLFIALVFWVGAILSVVRLKWLTWQHSHGDVKKYLYRNTSLYLFSSTDDDVPELRRLKRRVRFCLLGFAAALALAWYAG